MRTISPSKRAFSLLELIFVIVIIGILSVVAIPHFTHLTDNAKISSELATAASVQTEIDNCHGEWIVNNGNFICGADISKSSLNEFGYPNDLGSSLENILKNGTTTEWTKDGSDYYHGPASSDSSNGVPERSPDKTGKPDKNDYWEYNSTTGIFSLIDN